MRIGIFGGSFDPIHRGHIKVALKSIKELELDRLYFVPARQNPLKDYKPASPFHRMGMLALSLRNHSKFFICDYELNNPSPSYTYNTLKHFKKKFENCNFFLILGADNIKDFDKWHRFTDILSLCKLVIFGRNKTKNHCKYPHIFIEANLPYSSSLIRESLKQGHSIKKFVLKDVEAYIKQHNLYI